MYGTSYTTICLVIVCLEVTRRNLRRVCLSSKIGFKSQKPTRMPLPNRMTTKSLWSEMKKTRKGNRGKNGLRDGHRKDGLCCKASWREINNFDCKWRTHTLGFLLPMSWVLIGCRSIHSLLLHRSHCMILSPRQVQIFTLLDISCDASASLSTVLWAVHSMPPIWGFCLQLLKLVGNWRIGLFSGIIVRFFRQYPNMQANARFPCAVRRSSCSAQGLSQCHTFSLSHCQWHQLCAHMSSNNGRQTVKHTCSTYAAWNWD